MDKLKRILAKFADVDEVKDTDVSDEEKEVLNDNADDLSAEDKQKFASVLSEKGIDADKLKQLISKAVNDNLGSITSVIAERLSDEMASKFMKGVEDQRKKAIDGQVINKDMKSDEKVKEFMKAILLGDKARAKALSTSVSGASPDDAKAGILIPEELMNEVMRIAENQYGLARRDMFYLPFSGPGNSRKIPALGTSVSTFWTGEKGKKKSTQPKFGLVEQTLKKLAAIVPMTEEIMEDSAINLTALIAKLFAEAIAKEEDLQFFAGDGTVWTGILNNGDVLVQYQAVSGIANLTADDLLDLQDQVPTSLQANAKYYMHRTVLSVIRKLKDKDDNYIYQNPGQGLPPTLWNRPVELSDAMPAKSEVVPGSPYVIYGDLKQTCIFGDKQQIRVKLLEEATINDVDDQTAINLAEQDEVALRIVERVGYVIALPKGIAVLDAGTEESGS